MPHFSDASAVAPARVARGDRQGEVLLNRPQDDGRCGRPSHLRLLLDLPFVLDRGRITTVWARCAARPDGAGREVVEAGGGACHSGAVSRADRRPVPDEASGPEAAGR